MRDLLKRWTRELACDDGAAGLIAVSLVVIVAFTALSLFLSGAFGPARDLERLQAAERANAATLEAVMVHFIQNQTVACPDTNNDGDAESSCASGGTVSGRIPWRTLNLGPDAALDAYDRYYTYVVSGDDDEKAMCESVANDFGAPAEYTGNMTQPSRLRVLTTGATAGYYVPFAIISHGANGRGGVMRGASTAISGATGSELDNATANPSEIYTGPYTSDAEDPFDDNVIVPSSGKLQDVCEMLTPGGEANASFGDDFNAPGSFASAKWDVSGTGTPTQGAGQANFATSGAGYLATASGVNAVPSVRPIYIAAHWTPGANGNSFQIVTRAEPGNTANNGVTFTFGATTSVAENGDITVSPTDTLSVIGGQQYLLEVYDNGNDVWGRASQVSNPSNNASVRFSGVDNDLDVDDRVVFANGTGSNSLDDVIVGYPMLSLQTGANPPARADASNGTDTANLTLEAWVRPIGMTAGSIVAQWSTDVGATDNSFRLYTTGTAVRFAVNDTGDEEDDVPTGISLAPHTWTHIAIVFNGTTRTVTSYKDGQFVSVQSTDLTAGIHGATEVIGFGADSVFETPPSGPWVGANNFDGQIADVRIWNTVRSATQIATCFSRRIVASGTCDTTGLRANWRMDPASFAPTALAASGAGSPGARGSSLFTPALATHFRATSLEVCPNNQAGAYQCDYRTAGAQTVPTFPDTIATFYVKAWGGGEDGGGSTGEGAAYAGGMVDNNGPIISVTVGDHGTPGEDTVIDADDQDVVAPGGARPFNILNILLGLLGIALDSSTQDAANNTDPHYPPTTPGRGGAVGGNGNPGAVVLIW